MKKLLSICSIIIVLLFASSCWAFEFDGGDGTAASPYQITNANQLVSIGSNEQLLDKHFILTADIDLAGYSFTQAVIAPDIDNTEEFNQGPAFTGTFNGDGYRILNLTIDTLSDPNQSNDNNDFLGLFGVVSGEAAEIKYLAVENVNINGGPGADYVAGLVAGNDQANINLCYTTGNINAGYYVGGICGYNRQGKINNCYSKTNIDCSNIAGGLCGETYHGFIRDCYSTGYVRGANGIGGFCGVNTEGQIITCKWDIETSGIDYSNGSGVGLTTAEMYDFETFAPYWIFQSPFENIWAMPAEPGYPILAWQSGYKPSYGGTVVNPYQISNATQLISIGSNASLLDKHYILTADIDLAGYSFTQAVIAPDIDDTEIFNQGPAFTGTFNGDGYRILNLTIDTLSDQDPSNDDNDFLGLFGAISGETAEIKYLGVENININGGLGSNFVAGLVAGNDQANINLCYATGNIKANEYSGGLCGYNRQGQINNCYSTVNIDCNNIAGGLCGTSYHGSIRDCYSTGFVQGHNDIGGFCGINFEGEIINCGWDVETSGIDHSDGGEGLTTVEMYDYETFAPYWIFQGSFEDIWEMPAEPGYPILAWQTGGRPSQSGTAANPYKVENAEHLIAINSSAALLTKHYIQTADIDLKQYSFDNAVIAPDDTKFAGTYDGNGYKISNLNINAVATSSRDWDYPFQTPNSAYAIGLFGTISGSQTVLKNIVIENISASQYGSSYFNSNLPDHLPCIGGLCGFNEQANIDSCGVSGIVNQTIAYGSCGGLCGYNSGTITKSYSEGTVSGPNKVGGLCGVNYEGNIIDCYSSSTIKRSLDVSSTRPNLGGLCGICQEGSIIKNCYAVGEVQNPPTYSWDFSYTAGGLVDVSTDSLIINSCWDIETSGRETSAGGVGLTTVEMKTYGLFEPYWDFTDDNGDEAIWFMPEDSYPVLYWQRGQCSKPPLADISGDCIVDLFDFSLLANSWLECGYIDESLCP
ncbi:MAG: hypothetical protein JEZ07_10860 [Phycisphaerae bacterium]|nr:hypothetical protein [Phycisphaerae bacterium]